MRSMRFALPALGVWLVVAPFVGRSQAVSDAPLPDVEQLRQRAVANAPKVAAEREKYQCRELITSRDTDSKGNVKKTETEERETFLVNGKPISQTLLKNGKPLTEEETRKQDERVKKQIEDAMKTGKAPKAGGFSFSTNDFLRLAKLTNERRVLVAGRPTIVFDAAGDPAAKTDSLAAKFIQSMAGTVSIDEESGYAQDVNMVGRSDVKIGGGLVANVHKGFALHVVLARQSDGVWLIKQVDGKGDARVGLFMREGGDFSQVTEGCKLYNVTAEAGPATVVQPARP